MNSFWIVINESQTDGLTRFVRFGSYAEALAEAKRQASRYPDALYYVAEAVTVAVSPAPEVQTYELRPPLRAMA